MDAWNSFTSFAAMLSSRTFSRISASRCLILSSSSRLLSISLDLTFPLRGVTALSLALYLRYGDVARDLLAHLGRLRQLARAINLSSVDGAGRREVPIVTAARTGQADCVAAFIQLGVNVRVVRGIQNWPFKISR